MLNAFIRHKDRLILMPQNEHQEHLADALWVDLVDPTPEERKLVAILYGSKLPDADEVDEIEASARFYLDQHGLHIHSLFLHEVDGHPHNTSVAFTLNPQRLFSIREREIPVFRLLRLRARRIRHVAIDPASIYIALQEIKVEALADTLEEVHQGLEEVSQMVLETKNRRLDEAIDELTRHEDVNGKVRLCLMDTQRDLTFLSRYGELANDPKNHVRELLRDISSLLPHNDFLFQKVTFLMSAAQGFIAMEQNQIIKIFSIAAVVFLPPTLVASIYGMNFQFMPELHWMWGYPLAIILMVMAGVTPYWYFKRQGWL
ncbi:magnesium transporter CorA [Achromatium sp. WMS1]|nr:magnesium transporter CorA [Achromatium sp. WMS1]